MKTISLTIILLSALINSYAQNYSFDVRGHFERPVKKEVLAGANTLCDFIPGYPKNWITDYASVEIESIVDGKIMKARGSNDQLSMEQKHLLASADLWSELAIDVKHYYKNPVTDASEERNANIHLTVVPESEARYPGGEIPMRKYFMRNAMDKISESVSKDLKELNIRFIIDESGNVVDPIVRSSSGNVDVDELILKTVKNMPRWTPASNEKGEKLRQVFEFRAMNGGC